MRSARAARETTVRGRFLCDIALLGPDVAMNIADTDGLAYAYSTMFRKPSLLSLPKRLNVSQSAKPIIEHMTGG